MPVAQPPQVRFVADERGVGARRAFEAIQCRRLPGNRPGDVLVQPVQRARIHVQDDVIDIVEGQVEAARRITDPPGDGACAQAACTRVGHEGLGGGSHQIDEFAAAVIAAPGQAPGSHMALNTVQSDARHTAGGGASGRPDYSRQNGLRHSSLACNRVLPISRSIRVSSCCNSRR